VHGKKRNKIKDIITEKRFNNNK